MKDEDVKRKEDKKPLILLEMQVLIEKCKKIVEAAHGEAREIETVIHIREVKTRAATYFKLLVKWFRKPDYENSWISEKEFIYIDPYMCQVAKNRTRIEASSS